MDLGFICIPITTLHQVAPDPVIEWPSIIEEIDYSGQNLTSNNQFEIGSPAPHGLSISSDGNYIFTVSNTADWLYKISGNAGIIIASWGNDGLYLNRSYQIKKKLPKLHCLKINKNGEPAHPLYQKLNLKPIRFNY